MAKTIYLVKKNPESKKENTEWLQMSGEEFYRFIHSEEGEGRYFIHLTDYVGYEADEIYIEEMCIRDRHRIIWTLQMEADLIGAKKKTESVLLKYLRKLRHKQRVGLI